MQRYLLVVLLASLALLSLLPMPYGFYMLSRIANAVVFGVLAYRLHAANYQGWLVAVGFLVVYNPIITIHLGSKPLWTFCKFCGSCVCSHCYSSSTSYQCRLQRTEQG